MKAKPFTDHQQEISLEHPENRQLVNFKGCNFKLLHFLKTKSIMLLVLGVLCGTIVLAQLPKAVVGNDPWNSYNLIRNWNFTTDLTNWNYWVDASIPGQMIPVIGNGIVAMTTALSTEPYRYQFNQTGLQAEANVAYILKFKSWSSKPKTNHLLFEDSPNNRYNHYGASTDTESKSGRSEWVYTTTTEPAWFTFHVVFDQMVPTTEQKLVWQLATANATTYLDSVLLTKEDNSVVNTNTLALSATQLTIKETVSSATVNIASNTSWEVSTDQTWLTVNPPTGTGNRMITLNALPNPMFSTRTATVTVHAASLDPQTITVTQDAKQDLPTDPGSTTYGENWSDEVWNYYNLIKNWNFTTDLKNWGGWVDASVPGQAAPVVTNGIVSMATGLPSDGNTWHYQHFQSGLKAEANVPYILQFKSWSSASRSNEVVFEDSPQNNYKRYGASTDPESTDGRSNWVYSTDMEPRWFTFHVTFDQMVPTTEQKIQWMLSSAKATTYLDSIILIKDGDSTSVRTDYLVLSASTLSLEETDASATVNITSNTSWELRSDQPWLTVSPATGTGSQEISFAASANPVFAYRNAKVTVYAASIEPQTITVVQKAKQGIPIEPSDSIVEIWSSEAWNSYNLIKNWNFTSDLTNWGGWIDYNVSGQTSPVITNGILSMTTGYSVDGTMWHYQHNQSELNAEANVPYTLKFKSWSTANRSNSVDFEDGPENMYNRYGASTDLQSINGRSEWIYYTSNEPRWITFHVVFDQMKANTSQKIQWNLSTANATSYLDSVILIKDADLLLIKDADLVLSSSQVSLGAEEANTWINVTSNTNSMAISDQNWLRVNPPNVTGNQTITIATEANSSTTSRTATVTLYPAGMASKTITITQESTTGIDPILSDQQLMVYPNPTSGKIKLVFDQIPQNKTYLTVTDVTGKIVLKQLIQNIEEWIDLQGYTPGVYFIKTSLKGLKVHKILLK
ncbi:MAG TPA: BACON domain-containing carbohydrate-binding protein [Prolixibacteraceae bacterium]|jgi:hypothetical protein